MPALPSALNASLHMDIPDCHQLVADLPRPAGTAAHIQETQGAIADILSAKDDRLLVVLGPCSIHDPHASLEYAAQLAAVSRRYDKELLLVMRTYFEKPRTTVGWKGFINDPGLDEGFNIAAGLVKARQLLLDINAMGLATATEFLCPANALYIADLISWGAIGARTTESQIHRELASALHCPIGFKNSTDGNIQIAMDAIQSVQASHVIYAPKAAGGLQAVKTAGNPNCHIILRGGRQPNYAAKDVDAAHESLLNRALPAKIMVDCSHGNSQKQHLNQLLVGQSLCRQIGEGKRHIAAVMLESFLKAGKQAHKGEGQLVYGQSITDACIDWQDTIGLLDDFARAVNQRRQALECQRQAAMSLYAQSQVKVYA
ncbi:3-deoxy-7-phosphoheptulonate synthase [Shewanella sp. AS16]|uniref:3-deoxy-7-phosphoheptulonate synthase n=1 Tax=Shewanella sp. AS16 TaxID=2907625 RepID=UPI001F2EE255|nr:3-deoxy-7-phosphoheptulonate synthase [Shewanella sp. AS16]MCE9687285.1 3-deoxy-7-phosphoheptulonate synthase [Shewanella sp. AS16]